MRWLKRGGPTKADLKIVDLGQGALVIKDFSVKAAWVRWIGRLQIARECRAYRWLSGMPGIPRFAGRVDAHALAMEWIEGELLAFLPERRAGGSVTHGKLSEVVERMHDAGLVHLDLRGKDNVVLTPDGRVYVLDLAAAVWFRPGGWPHRLFFRRFVMTDIAALLKWKRILGSEPYTEDEQAFLRRYGFWRALWIFNRKRPPGE
jgi:serine/threonine protein kinase